MLLCINPIRARYADLDYHCANPSCDNVCHLAATCSGFVYPRGNARPRPLSTRIWHIHLHSATPSATSPSASPHPSSLANNSSPRPNSPSLTSLLNQGLSLADAKNLKEKCAKCSTALRSNTVPVRCSVCSKGFHQKCSTRPKASARNNLWKCEKCTNIQQNCTSKSANRDPTNSLPSQPVPSTTPNKLKIYQWNADGIRPKLLELRDHLLNSDIDILAVQELKLQKTDKTPSIESYATIRKDSNNILSGGLLLFIRTDIVFEKLDSFEKGSMEIQSIRIKVTKSSWLDLYNVYLLNTATQHTSFDPSLIKPGPSSLFLGDLNGHSQMWDPIQPQDQGGDEILDWILDNDLHILNDGSATRTSQITGNDSTPHISLCGSNWSAKSSWRLAEPIGNSDHLPIIIELNHKISYKPVIPRSARWCRNGVDWSSFTNDVETKMSNLPNEPNLSLRVSRFNDILISAATTHIGKSKPSRRSKPCITPYVRAKIRNRNHLRQTIHQNRQEWIDACREATKAINDAKTESWKNLLQDAMLNSDGPNMWKVIQGLNGTPDANSLNEAMSHNGRTITDTKSKANVFINHYARISKLKMSQSDCDIKRQFKKNIKVSSADDESCAPILMSKLQSPIKKMKGKGAAGPDNIPPLFLKSLSPLAFQEYYPSSTHLSHSLIAHESGGLPLSFHYSTLVSPLVK